MQPRYSDGTINEMVRTVRSKYGKNSTEYKNFSQLAEGYKAGRINYSMRWDFEKHHVRLMMAELPFGYEPLN